MLDQQEVLSYIEDSLQTISTLEKEKEDISKQAEQLQGEKVKLEKVASDQSLYSFSNEKVDNTVNTLLTFNIINKQASENIKSKLKNEPDYSLDLIMDLIKQAASYDEGTAVDNSNFTAKTDPHGWLGCK